MTKHARERLKERFDGVDYAGMEKACSEFHKNGEHVEIDDLMDCKNGSTILRYHGQEAVVYPVISKARGVVITVYTQAMYRAKRNNARFVEKMKRSQRWFWNK